jgi:hypothetical protein
MQKMQNTEIDATGFSGGRYLVSLVNWIIVDYHLSFSCLISSHIVRFVH